MPDELSIALDQCEAHGRYVRALSASYLRLVRCSWGMFLAHSRARDLRDCTRDAIEDWLIDGTANHAWKPATYRAHHRNI